DGTATVAPTSAGALLLAPDGGATVAAGGRLELYLGPLDRRRLAEVDPQLRALLFSGLWPGLRELCLGLLWLLETLVGALGSAGLAIIALSVLVKLGLRPFTRLAERWQAQVDR